MQTAAGAGADHSALLKVRSDICNALRTSIGHTGTDKLKLAAAFTPNHHNRRYPNRQARLAHLPIPLTYQAAEGHASELLRLLKPTSASISLLPFSCSHEALPMSSSPINYVHKLSAPEHAKYNFSRVAKYPHGGPDQGEEGD